MEIFDIFFNLDVMRRAFPILLRGLVNTLLLGAAATLFGGILGVLICLVRLYAPKPLRLLAVLFIDVMRAIPVLVVLILVYYALPFAGIVFSSFVAATIALSLVLAAYFVVATLKPQWLGAPKAAVAVIQAAPGDSRRRSYSASSGAKRRRAAIPPRAKAL